MRVVNGMRKSLLTISSAALLVGAAACSSDLTGLGLGSVTGTYQLETFNGSVLPTISFQDNFEQDRLLAETFMVFSDGTYEDDYTLRITTSSGTSDQSFRDVGTFQQNNNAIQFRDSRTANVFTGSITGNTLTITQLGDIYVFRR